MDWLPRLLTWLRGHPLFVLATTAVTGILIADQQQLAPSLALGLATVVVGLPALHRPRLWKFVPAVLLAFMLLHAQRLQHTYQHPLRHQLLALPDRPAEAGIKARLYPWTDGAELDEGTALAEVTHLRWGDAGPYLPMQMQVRVALPRGYRLEGPGEHEIQGKIALPKRPMNPGQFDPVDYGLRMGWIAEFQAQSVTRIAPDSWALRYHLLQAAESSRQWITEKLSLGMENEAPHAAVILAMALGASDAAGEDIEDAFRDSGTLHVFAVSGLHVVMLAQIASWLLRGVGTQRLMVLLIFLVFAYAFITGWRPSAARAAFMISILLIAPLLHRKSQLTNTLGAAALVLLLMDSNQLFLVGFQLSFGVLLAIALGTAGLLNGLRRWYELDPFLPPMLASRRQRFVAWSRQFTAALVCVSITAWAGSLLFMIGHFQTVTPVAVVANLLLVPASGLCLILTCASLLAAACQFGALVLGLNLINAKLAWLMVTVAGWFASWPGGNFTLDLRFQKDPAPAEMRVFHIPHGGAASHLRVGQVNWLLDTAHVRPWRSILRPYLRSQGVDRLEALVLSHADMDHIGAAPLALRLMKPPRVHTSQLEPWSRDFLFTGFQALMPQIMPDGPAWTRHGIDAVLPISADATATVLYPSAQDLHDLADDRALVLLLKIGSTRILCLSDSGFVTEKRLMERLPHLRCDVLIRHQHPGDHSALPDFLTHVQPQVIISSHDSRDPSENLPAHLIRHCEQQRITLMDLELCGSVGLEVWPDHLKLTPFRQGQSLLIQPRAAL